MNLSKSLSILIFFIFVSFVVAAVPNIAEDFETEKIPAGWTAEKGQLSISSTHAKQNQKSLLWQWKKGGKFVICSPEILSRITTITGGGDSIADGYEPRFVEDTKQGGIKAWVYNEKPCQGKLLFKFGGKNTVSENPKYQFEFGLNFHGWRAMWVHLEEDAQNPSYKGDEPVTVMEVLPPGEVSCGSVYFDLFEFTDYVSWKRTADNQLPMLNMRRNMQKKDEKVAKDVEVEPWNDIYLTSRWSPAELPAAKITDRQKRAFEEIERRYNEWVFGDGSKDSAEPVKIRKRALQQFIENGLKKYEQLQIKRNGDVITGIGLYSVRDTRKPDFGKAVLRPVILPLVLDYRINGNQESLKKALDVFDYLHDQGWACGSGLGTLNHHGNSVSGYMHAVYLLKDELKKAGKLNRELATIRWMTSFNEVYKPQMYRSATADTVRTKYMYRLLAVLCMDDSPQRVQDMQYLGKWLTFALKIAPGFADTIKPDFTGYHHRGAYGSAYAPQAYHMASVVVYLLHDTPFAVSQEAHQNLRQALLAQRLYCNMYDVPVAISGRFPYNTSMLNRMLPSYAYMALSKEPVDTEIAAVFKRLWRPENDLLRKKLFTLAESKISYFDTLGAVELMCKLAERKDIEAESAPSGHWTKPYAGLAIHRRDNWLATVKGWSQYIWDFEASNTQNVYGRYLSNGTMQIYSAGNPVTALANGYDPDNGWDWNRWPGATIVHLPWEKLKADKRVSQMYKEGKHRNFSDETFVGGVDFENSNGVFAVKLHDTAYDNSFRANKSYFFFGNEIVCLGSGIKNNNADYPTETVLFQFSLQNTETAVYINTAKAVTRFPYSFASDTADTMWVMDPAGNAYVLPRASGLHLIRNRQNSMHHSGKKTTSGDYATAWIDHGRKPLDAGYEYAVLVQANPESAAEYAASPRYKVLQKNNAAHIVHHSKLGITGYAIFDADESIGYGPVRKTTAPVLVMAKEQAGCLKLSICDPDFRRPKMCNMSLMPGHVLYAESMPGKVNLHLNGCWELQEGTGNIKVAKSVSNITIVSVVCTDAATIEMSLKKAD